MSRIRPRFVLSQLTELDDRIAPARWAVSLLDLGPGVPGQTAATHSGRLRLNPDQPTVGVSAIVEAKTAVDAVRSGLFGAVAVQVAGRTAYYSYAADTVGTAVSDHQPFLVSVQGTRGTVRLEDLTRLPELGVDWDYDDRSWRVDVRKYNGPVPGSGGGITTFSESEEVVIGSWAYEWVSPHDETATVTATVTYNKSSFEGLYHWNYHIDNHTFGALYGTSLTTIYVQAVHLSEDDVYEIKNQDGISGELTQDFYIAQHVRWPAPTPDGLAPGESGDVWFTTNPLPVASAVGEMWETSTAMTGGGYTKQPGLKPSIVITDKSGAEIAADKGLKVAKWHDAFEMNGANAVKVRGPDENKHDFIDRDDDRFNVWVWDPLKWFGDAGVPPVDHLEDVTIATTNVVGFTEYNDPATKIDLVKYTGNAKAPGWYWSDSQMLVSNKVDDEYHDQAYLRVDEEGPGELGPLKNNHKWKVSDRTHRVALRGTVTAKYSWDGVGVVQDVDPVRHRKEVKVHVNILRDAAGGKPAITIAEADAYMRIANELYAQVGILILPQYNSGNYLNPPVPGMLEDGLEVNTEELVDGMLTLTDEERSLLTYSRTTAADDVELYYINFFGNRRTRLGQSYWFNGVPERKYADAVIISTEAHLSSTAAHEIGHVLMNDGSHYDRFLSGDTMPTRTNLMRAQPEEGDEWANVEGPKRLTVAQEQRMYSQWP